MMKNQSIIESWKGSDWHTGSSGLTSNRVIPEHMTHRIMSAWILDISSEGKSTTPLGNLFQCMVTRTMKKFFFIFREDFL